jgi:tetratricopeptide (TPR) repeat protein
MGRLGRTASALAAAALAAAAAAGEVRVFEETHTIPTYEEGLPDPNPPFDLFTSVRFDYPYTMRENLTARRRPRAWRVLVLENEHLRVEVLPDLGGRLWRCIDKANGASLFYANPTLKFAQVAYRGSWATFGIEWNFPVSHNWVTSSPVDWATVRHADGRASIVVGNVDLVYGMQWRVELTLRPGRAALEQQTTLYNRSDLPHRFYWWTNAAVEVQDDSRILYPMDFTAAHGFAEVDTWPVSAKGVDLSRPGNHTFGPVSLFAHGSHEGFMGIYHPRTRAGVAHYADPAELPAKKVWSWGRDADGLDWRLALSDNGSAEAEIQAGLFRDQETYAFLAPQEEIRFRETWLPVREIGGFSRVTSEAVLNLEREPSGALRVGLNVSESLRDGVVRILAGATPLVEERLSLEPSSFFGQAFAGLPAAARYTVEVADAHGRVIVRHTEGVYDNVPRSDVTLGPQKAWRCPPPESRSDDDFAELGRSQELEGKLLVAYTTYGAGLRRYPGSFALAKAAGRLAVALKRYDEAVDRLLPVEARATQDPELAYALGLAFVARGETSKARPRLEAAGRARATRPAALLQLARLDAIDGRIDAALGRLHEATAESPGMTRAGALEVALLRRSGRLEAARTRVAHWLAVDPTSGPLRHENVLLGGDDPGLFAHLAGEPQRILDVAVELMSVGAYDDALALVSREWPKDGVVGEPGALRPESHPELAYYRAYCRERTGQNARADYETASRLPTTYVFPNRAESLPVLERAVEVDPGDATAHFLLGSLHLSGGQAERALAEWDEALRLDPKRPVLHRNVGLTLLYTGGDLERARAVLVQGTDADATNPQVYLALDQTLELLGRPAAERAAALQRYPDPAGMPSALVLDLALVLADEGRFDEAERLFRGRFFPREEFGTNVRAAWLEVRLARAFAAARAGRPKEALSIADALGRPVEGLAFTHDGLGAFLDEPRFQFRLGEMLTLCRDDARARASWARSAAAGDGFPFLGPVYAHRAAQRLGPVDEAPWRARLEHSLEAIDTRLVVGTNYPGLLAAARGLTLDALGRDAEARAEIDRALLLPDKRLAHRIALETEKPVRKEASR